MQRDRSGWMEGGGDLFLIMKRGRWNKMLCECVTVNICSEWALTTVEHSVIVCMCVLLCATVCVFLLITAFVCFIIDQGHVSLHSPVI